MSSLAYVPRLDGYRALAVGAVLFDHFLASPIVDRIGIGSVGVRSFYVLSGYLITRILLEYRALPVGSAARTFYKRRLLRLTPAYYLAIFVGIALGLWSLRTDWWVHALYLTNFQIAIREEWVPLGYFWSLSVEEQFYIGWFFVVVMLAPSQLKAAIAGCFLASALYRLSVFTLGMNPLLNVLLPASVDYLAAGALLGLSESNGSHERLRAALSSNAALVGSAVFLTFAISLSPTSLTREIVYPYAVILMSVTLICACTQRKDDNVFLDILSFGPIRHIGRISYGIYVYHMFVLGFFWKYFPIATAHEGRAWRLVCSLIYVATTLLVAELSWRFIEKPILANKRGAKNMPTAWHQRAKSS